MLGSRFTRLVAVIFVSGAGLSLLWPQATGHVSTFAVVNAPVLTIRAPMNGSVKSPSLELAEPVRRGDGLFVLHAGRESRAELARLASRRAALGSQIEAMVEEEQAMTTIATQLAVRILDAKMANHAYLGATLDQARANRALHEVEHHRAAETLSRVARLAATGSASDTALIDARHDLDAAQSILLSDDAFIATLKIERNAVDMGVASPQGVRSGDYLRERQDEIFLRRADLVSRRKSADGEFAAISQLHVTLTEETDTLNDFRPTSAVDGVIWSASHQSGSDVNAGDEIVQVLDCQRRFIEVNFSESAFENLSPGTVANVRLKGSNTTIETTVLARHAVTGGANSALDGAVVDRVGIQGITVFLRLGPADISDPEVASAFCDVGRTAEVHIPRDELGAIGAWVRAAVSYWVPGAQETKVDVAAAPLPLDGMQLVGATNNYRHR